MRRFLLLAAILSARVVHGQPALSPLQRPLRPMREAAQQHYLSGVRSIGVRSSSEGKAKPPAIGLLAGGALVVGGAT